MNDSRLNGAAAADAAAATIRDRLGVRAPVAAIVLGSGLGDLAARIENPRSVPYAGIPGFHATNIAGHRGELICGTLAGKRSPRARRPFSHVRRPWCAHRGVSGSRASRARRERPVRFERRRRNFPRRSRPAI